MCYIQSTDVCLWKQRAGVAILAWEEKRDEELTFVGNPLVGLLGGQRLYFKALRAIPDIVQLSVDKYNFYGFDNTF